MFGLYNYNRKIIFGEMLQVQSDTIKELSCLTVKHLFFAALA